MTVEDREMRLLRMVREISAAITSIIDAVDRFKAVQNDDIKEDRKHVLLSTLDICADMLDEVGDTAGREMVITLKRKFLTDPSAPIARCKPHLKLVDPSAP